MKCRNCQHEIGDRTAVCPYCNRPVYPIPADRRPAINNRSDLYYNNEEQRTPATPVATMRRVTTGPTAGGGVPLNNNISEMPTPPKSNRGWITTVVVLSVVCVILAILAFVPGVSNIFSGSDTSTAEAVEVPERFEPGMELSNAIQVPGVSLSIITSYEAGKAPIHTLYLLHNGMCYETNVTDADGGWSYLTPQGKDAMRRALSGTGIVGDFNVECLMVGAQILTESRLSIDQIQREQDRKKEDVGQTLVGIAQQFYASRNLRMLTPQCAAAYSARKDGPFEDPILGDMQPELCTMLSKSFECTDVQNGIVKFTGVKKEEDGTGIIKSRVITTFKIERTPGGEYLISSISSPRIEEISREEKVYPSVDEEYQ